MLHVINWVIRKNEQGQPVHKLQIPTFWDIYIYIERERDRQREKERERDIIKFCVCEMVKFCVKVMELRRRLVPGCLQVYKVNSFKFEPQTNLQSGELHLTA